MGYCEFENIGGPPSYFELVHGLNVSPLFPFTACNEHCLIAPKLRLWDAASSEFGRVLPGFLFKGYLRCFLQVRVTATVKRIKTMGEEPG
jgi:hypothetical protein